MGSEQPYSEAGESTRDRFSRLAHLVQEFLEDDDVPQEFVPLLQECAEIWASYVDACHDIAMQAPKEDAAHLSRAYLRLNETAFIYYMIVHTILNDRVPKLGGFSNTDDKKPSDWHLYTERLHVLQNDPNIEQIRSVIGNYPKLAPLQSIDPSKLSSLLHFHDDAFLLVDVRPRPEFIKAHIKCKHIMCIDPASFKDSYTDTLVERVSLAASPQLEIELFSKRNTFKNIVLYTDTQLQGDFQQRQTRILANILTRHSVAKVSILETGFRTGSS